MRIAPVKIVVWLWRWMVSAVARFMQNILTAFIQIWANKGRAILTTLGIVIAVTSIITVVSFVQGFGKFTTELIQGYGTQFMVVRPYWQSASRRAGMRPPEINLADIDAVRADCPAVQRMSPFVYWSGEVTYGHEKVDNIAIRGVTEDYQTIRNFHVDDGRFFGPIDVEAHARVAVLGRTLLKRLECDESIIGDYIYLNSHRFRVIGLLESKGSFLGDDQDETIMVPYTVALQMQPTQRRALFFLAEAESEDKIDLAFRQITRVLRFRHGLQAGQPNDFYIDRQDQMVREFNSVRDIASASLAGIVSISLLVGGIGIMNVMLVSVTERTREIGLRKSVGARKRDIMLQFLTEAVVLCTLGGTIGILFGYALTNIAALHPKMIEIEVPFWAVLLAVAFSAAAGVIFGIIPAFKAAILHPIDALRHE